MTDPIKDMAAQLRSLAEQRAAALRSTPDFAELLRLHKSLNGLEGAMGETLTPLSEFFGFQISGADIVPTREATGAAVRVDEFFNMDALEAAKAYLRKHRDARQFQEIVAAIRNGGGKIENEDKLRTGLGRSTLDVVKFGDHYGWLDNYPEEKSKRTKGLRRGSGPSDDGNKKAEQAAATE